MNNIKTCSEHNIFFQEKYGCPLCKDITIASLEAENADLRRQCGEAVTVRNEKIDENASLREEVEKA